MNGITNNILTLIGEKTNYVQSNVPSRGKIIFQGSGKNTFFRKRKKNTVS